VVKYNSVMFSPLNGVRYFTIDAHQRTSEPRVRSADDKHRE
jgi:hypothetical protein